MHNIINAFDYCARSFLLKCVKKCGKATLDYDNVFLLVEVPSGVLKDNRGIVTGYFSLFDYLYLG